MTPRTLISAAVCGFVLLGCAASQPNAASIATCENPECRVAVPVTEDGMGGCQPDAVPDTLYVRSKGTSVIFWDIELKAAHEGYRFADQGIVFDDSTGEFFDCAKAADGKSFKCKNKHSQPGAYKYTINVVKGSKSCTPQDPSIVNE